jgi:hypothetical protein
MVYPQQLLMRGVTNLRGYVATFLEAQLPLYLAAARAQWNLEDHRLPTPLKYDSYDPMSSKDFPVVGMYVNRTGNWRRVGINPYAEEQYTGVYAVRLFIWCRTPRQEDEKWVEPEYDEALRVRDDELALLRTCLMRNPSLGSNGACRMEEGSLSEDYLEPILGSGGSHWLAGGILSFDVVFNEANYSPTINTAEDIQVTVQKMSEGAEQ